MIIYMYLSLTSLPLPTYPGPYAILTNLDRYPSMKDRENSFSSEGCNDK